MRAKEKKNVSPERWAEIVQSRGSLYKEPRYNKKGRRSTGTVSGFLRRGVGWIAGGQYRWCATIMIDRKRYRHRSANRQECLNWLDRIKLEKLL